MDIPQKKETPGSGAPSGKSARFKPDLNRYRRHSKRSNSEADDFVYVRKKSPKIAEPLSPNMAGQTNADPNYSIDLSINGFGERYLTVLEYVVSGSGYIYYNGIKRRVYAGCFYILHPIFTGHYQSDPADPFVKKWANINGRIVPALMKAYGWNDQATVFKNCPKAEQYMDRIHELLSDYDDDCPAADNRELVHIIVDLFDYLASGGSKTGSGEKPAENLSIDKIVSYVNNNLAYGKISVETLSQIFCISQRSLSRLFKKELGVSPGNFLTAKKIELAQRMLSENYSVEEVSETLLFSSPEYFRKVFVSVCGISPQKWKKNLQTKRP